MAHHKSAKKRIRSDEKKRSRNHSYISSVRSAVKALTSAFEEPGEQKLPDLLKSAQSKLAKAAAKGMIHKNAASRKIARLTKALTKATSADASVTKKVTKKKSTKKTKAKKSKSKKK